MNLLSEGKRLAVENRGNLAKDFLSSIVVFLVALPLCMGIAIASGLPPAAGLLTGMVGGLVVGFLAGCPLQVSGPAAGLTVIVWEIVQKHGIDTLGVIILFAGLIQLLAGLMKLGQWFRAVSPAVINGVLSGIGVLILASQFHVMLDDKPKGSGISNLLSIPKALWDCLPLGQSTDNSHIAGLIGLLTIITLIAWSAIPIKQLRVIPAALVAVVAATITSVALHLNINTVQVPDNLLVAVHFPKLEAFARITDWTILVEAVGLAFIASAETLLTATAIDRMSPGLRTKYDKELAAQGIGNMLCGILGATPMTGVIVRSSANVQAGARTRMSTVLHGFWLLLFVAFLPFVLRLIPTSCLAALLVYTGYKLTNFKVAKSLAQFGKSELAIYVLTVAAIVATDLLTGVVVGMLITTAKLLYNLSQLDIRVEPRNGKTEVFVRGSATFVSLPKLAAALEGIPGNTELHVRLDQLDYIDHACLDLLMNWEAQHKAQGGRLSIDWGAVGATFQQDALRKQSLQH